MLGKIIYFGKFTFRYTYQHYSNVKGTLVKSGKQWGAYSGEVPLIFLEGEEEKAWEIVKQRLGESKVKKFTFVQKEIKNKINTGRQIIPKSELKLYTA